MAPLVPRWPPGQLCFTLPGEWSLHEVKYPEQGYPATDIGFRKIAEPAAWRGELWVFVLLAFAGARLASGPAWRPLSLARISGVFVAAVGLPGFGTSRA
jgi:hypothetical protein